MSAEQKLEILLDDTFTLKIDVYQNDEPLTDTPSTNTIDIRKPSGELIVTDGSLTQGAGPEGANNRFTYQIAAASVDEIGEDFSAFFKIDYSGDDPAPIRHTIIYDVVKTLLSPMVTQQDLYDEAPSLEKLRELGQMEGIVDSATSTTIVDTVLTRHPDDYFTGGVVDIIGGTADGERREITDFVRSTGTVTVAPAFDTTPDSTSHYRIARGWHTVIDRAFERIRARIRNKGYRPALVIDGAQLYWAHVLLSISMCYRAAANAAIEPAGGPLRSIAAEYMDKYVDEFNSLELRYDIDEDTVPEGTVEFASTRTVRR